jgi:hypothetical protein
MMREVSKQDTIEQVGPRCWKTGGACVLKVTPEPRTCLLVFPFGGQYMDAVIAVIETFARLG